MNYIKQNKIKYEGPTSKNPFAFKYYNAEEEIKGKKMKDHLRFSMAYWHTLVGGGADPFGDKTMFRPWDNGSEIENAKNRVKVAFQMMENLGIEYFCFHDKDIVPEQSSLAKTHEALDEVVTIIEEEMKRTGIKCLWGTTNAFTNPRFVHGAATSCNADVFAYAACQVMKALEIAKRLNAEGYVFWGGREGYETLLNTNMKLELDNLARLLKMAVDYANEIDFKGQFYIEPKPKEPTKHQYDFDAATVIGFLQKYNLDKYFKLNIETNHATLAQHTMQHELRLAADNDMLGSVDANQGDMLLGWDTDQFPTNIYETTLIMYEVLRSGGFKTGGLNFDAKVRRGSFEEDDLILSHIVGMDTFAKGFKVAAKLIEDNVFENILEDRYSSWTEGIGKDIIEGKVSFKELKEYVLSKDSIAPNKSGRQELIEGILNQYIFESK